MRTYEFCKLSNLIDDIQTVEFVRKDLRPTDNSWQVWAVLRSRDIDRPTEQTGTAPDPITGEQMPVYEDVPDKYLKWTGESLAAMTEAERTARDIYDVAQKQSAIDTRPTRGLEQLTLSQLTALDALIGSTFADSIPFAPGVNIQIAGAIEAYVSNDEISTDNKITALKTGAHLQNLMININAMDSGALYTDYFGN